MKQVLVGLIITLLIIFFVSLANKPKPEGMVLIGGGPEGSTFVVFAEGLAELLQKKSPELDVKVIETGGSVTNLRNIEDRDLDLAWAYAGDLYLGYQGELLPNKRFVEVLTLGRAYGSTAHLVVPDNSHINTPYDLINRRVAIGNSGSGSAHSAERYFRSIGIWERITPLYMGYDLGIRELCKGLTEAVWQLSSVPSPSITALSEVRPIRLINLLDAAREHGFFEEFPFYTSTAITPGIYSGELDTIESFEDNTLLITHRGVNSQLIDRTLQLLYSPRGISHMRDNLQVAVDLSRSRGLQGILTPLHPQAVEFWTKQGITK